MGISTQPSVDGWDLLKGRLQSKYKFVLKAAFLYADIPAKTNFSEKFMF